MNMITPPKIPWYIRRMYECKFCKSCVIISPALDKYEQPIIENENGTTHQCVGITAHYVALEKLGGEPKACSSVELITQETILVDTITTLVEWANTWIKSFQIQLKISEVERQ